MLMWLSQAYTEILINFLKSVWLNQALFLSFFQYRCIYKFISFGLTLNSCQCILCKRLYTILKITLKLSFHNLPITNYWRDNLNFYWMASWFYNMPWYRRKTFFMPERMQGSLRKLLWLMALSLIYGCFSTFFLH